MQPRLAALAACLLVASSAASAAPAAPQLRSAELSKGVRLSWAADAKDQTIDVQFAFDFGALKPDAPPGYIAVGLSETGARARARRRRRAGGGPRRRGGLPARPRAPRPALPPHRNRAARRPPAGALSRPNEHPPAPQAA